MKGDRRKKRERESTVYIVHLNSLYGLEITASIIKEFE